MNFRSQSQLAEFFTKSDGHPIQIRQAVVYAHTAGPPSSLTLTIYGTNIAGVRYLSSYTVADGDVVFALQQGQDILVLGKLTA